MSDLISRQAAIDALDDIETEVADGLGFQYEKWREYFSELPSAQKKGEWIACEHDKWMHGVYALRCSNCNGGYHLSTEQTIGTWDFCPTCGADMRKEVEENV